MKPKRCGLCKQIIYPWQPSQAFPRGDELHKACADDVKRIWKQDQQRYGG
jgi:hypothetical protein